MSHIDETALHGSLRDPVMGSLNFLNEITARYPDAISFAPGAPNLIHLDDLDVTRCIDLFVNHLRTDCGFTAKRARRLLYEYGPSRGIINDLVARALRADFDIGVCADDIVITVGAQEAMLVAVRALCRPGTDLLAITNPSFVGITGAARLLDVGIVPVDEVSTGLDLDYLVAACRRARAEGRRIRAFYVAPDFANPSGTVLDLATRKELLDIAEREDLFLLEDNAYGFTAQPGAELGVCRAPGSASSSPTRWCATRPDPPGGSPIISPPSSALSPSTHRRSARPSSAGCCWITAVRWQNSAATGRRFTAATSSCSCARSTVPCPRTRCRRG